MSGLLAKYAQYLPVTEQTPKLSLGEGNTPLVHAENLSKELSAQIYLKLEGLNPTGSFKDRGMVMAVAKAKEEGAKAIICASTGNTSASAAAYAAKAGLKCYVVIPDGYVAMGKLAQAIMYGAEIIPIKGNFDQALDLVKKLSESHPIQLVNSVNPYRIEGQKTGSYEIIEQLGKAPDIFALPVGNAGNITAYWKGFKEAFNHQLSTSKPKMWGFEAEGAAAIVKNEVIKEPDTFATAIRIGNPASWEYAVQARDESGGMIDFVTDEEIRAAYYTLAEKEGVFCEPASAASVAGILKRHKQGDIPAGSTIVCILTGNGLKDPTSAMEKIKENPKAIQGTEEELVQTIFASGGV
ncbi:threonine synthase [Caldalkalibacillus mannanilyticus]|uniref:threonine synthase n=1 Tax=Caldalkalibacillus mannanilyticus TaxID=1418 RepID=UPI00046A397A|nr:threonine synthase [Caldalkalibacillus mannanilyticus]